METLKHSLSVCPQNPHELLWLPNTLKHHTKLTRCWARSNDLLYPIQQLSNDEIIRRGSTALQELYQWELDLPPFLRPRPTASLGIQTWERQNSVLGLALAHSRILATRRSLLIDAATLQASCSVDTLRQHEDNVKACISSIRDIIDRVHPMMNHGRLLWGFWLTQYIAMCAISTLFVYKIQRRRGSMSVSAISNGISGADQPDDPDLKSHFQKAEEVQQYLGKMAPAGSQAKRHHKLLSRLRQRANKGSMVTTSNPQKKNVENGITQSDPQSPLDMIRNQAVDLNLSEITNGTDHFPPLSASDEGFTPGLLFDFAFPDASSWQYLDQLGSVPLQFDINEGVGTWHL
jgi:hypothetical protein